MVFFCGPGSDGLPAHLPRRGVIGLPPGISNELGRHPVNGDVPLLMDPVRIRVPAPRKFAVHRAEFTQSFLFVHGLVTLGVGKRIEATSALAPGGLTVLH
jgi:hypothetical protein